MNNHTPKKIPLVLEGTNEVIGEAWVDGDGKLIRSKLTPEAHKKLFPIVAAEFSVDTHQDEVSLGHRRVHDCPKYQTCDICRKYE